MSVLRRGWMVLVLSEPGMPCGRGRIERFSQTITERFLCLLPGHPPNGVRPGATLLTLTELNTRLREILLEDCRQRIQVVVSRFRLSLTSKIDGLSSDRIDDVTVRK